MKRIIDYAKNRHRWQTQTGARVGIPIYHLPLSQSTAHHLTNLPATHLLPTDPESLSQKLQGADLAAVQEASGFVGDDDGLAQPPLAQVDDDLAIFGAPPLVDTQRDARYGWETGGFDDRAGQSQTTGLALVAQL